MIISICLQEAEIYDFSIERTNDGQTIYFSVEGAIENVDQKSVKDALEAQDLHPQEITLDTGEMPDDSETADNAE